MTKALKTLLLAAVLLDLAASAAEAKQLQGGPLNAPKFDGLAGTFDLITSSTR